jgi:tetratricopeptide (TPR) repeat protein
MKKLLLLFTLICNAAFVTAKPAYDLLWKNANRCYQQKEYDSAAYYYEQIAAGNPETPEVYYNLGNAYYKLNQIGPAVLNYERTLRLNPAHKEAEDNLSLAQSRIINRIQPTQDVFFVKWWQKLTAPSQASTWAIISAMLFICFISLLLLKRFGKLSAPGQFIGFVFLLWLCICGLSYASSKNKLNSGMAVVMQQDTPFTLSPDGKQLSLVPEGTTIKWESESKGWVKTVLPDGRTGYMRKDALGKI